MTREELNYLIHKGKITVTGLVDKKGNINPKLENKDLDDVANTYITVPGITDGTSEGRATSAWIKAQKKKENKDSAVPTTPSSGDDLDPLTPSQPIDETPTAQMPIIDVLGLDDAIECDALTKATVKIAAKDYAGANVKMTWTAENAVVKIANKDVWTAKSLKDKELVLAVTPSEGATHNIVFTLVDDLGETLATYECTYNVISNAPAAITTFAALKDALEAGGNVTLGADIDVETSINVTDTAVLDLNGYSLYNTTDIWNDANDVKNWSIFSVRGGNLTINGEGSVAAKKDDCYVIDIRDNGTLTINNGMYNGNITAVYVIAGTANIAGGSFDVQQLDGKKGKAFMLNCLDSAYVNETASIVVTGGSFNGFNPAANAAESNDNTTNFVADGYTVNEADGVFTVVKA